MIKIELTREEATALIQLIDLACRQAGLNVAEAAVVLSRKIRDKLPSPQESPKEEL